MISDRQNEDRAIDFMKARQSVWLKAKKLLLLQIFASVALPTALTVLGLFYAQAKPFAATLAIFISVLDLSILDRAYKSLLNKAAKLGEEFDTFVLDIPWNPYICGPRLDHETIVEETAAFDKRSNTQDLNDWYPLAFRDLPTPVARFMCQRTNLWYDSKMRRRYSSWLLAAILLLCGCLVATALLKPLPLGDLVLTYLAPLSPVVLWSVREYFRQRDTTTSQEQARQTVEGLWVKVADGALDPQTATSAARQLQDAIYLRRSSSPLIFPGLYSGMRKKLENQLNAGAAKMVDDYKSIYEKRIKV